MNREPTKLIGRIQEAVDTGVTRVEEIHKAIADLPLTILEETGVLPETAREVRRFQDRTLGAIYRTIREVNDRVGTYASELAAETARRPRRSHAGAERHAA